MDGFFSFCLLGIFRTIFNCMYVCGVGEGKREGNIHGELRHVSCTRVHVSFGYVHSVYACMHCYCVYM